MTDLKGLLNYIKKYDYVLTASENMIVQKERNELKYNLLAGIVDVLVEAGLPSELIHRTADGYIIEVQNEEHGFIPVQLDVKVKNLNYDLDAAIEDWEIKVEEKRLKEEKKRLKEERKKAKNNTN